MMAPPPFIRWWWWRWWWWLSTGESTRWWSWSLLAVEAADAAAASTRTRPAALPDPEFPTTEEATEEATAETADTAEAALITETNLGRGMRMMRISSQASMLSFLSCWPAKEELTAKAQIKLFSLSSERTELNWIARRVEDDAVFSERITTKKSGKGRKKAS